MLKNYVLRFLRELKTGFKTEHSKFILLTGLKVTAISLIISLTIYLCLLEVLRLNYAFFQSRGFPELIGKDVFYDFLMAGAVESLPRIFVFHVALFFIGAYVGWLILRPFEKMGEYCEHVVQSPNMPFIVEEFSTHRLLTRFSEFFFEYLRESRDAGELRANSIPPQFMRIHKPVTDPIFMLHFGLLLVIVALCSSVFIIENLSTVFSLIPELANRTLLSDRESSQFLVSQSFILDDLIGLSIFLIVVLYLMLGFHLYSKVSGAAFGIFSTMRSFMKGNHQSRVHLIGYAHIRDYTRKLNKYLDYIEAGLAKEKKTGR
jgi:hypothetical protein